MNPLVSIIIPVYNGSNYMREAIDSALAQTYCNIEVIVVNDGSTDITEEIALSYGDQIRYYAKENGGVSSALNLGIEVMRGEYFSWLSHDDAYFPDKIESQVKALCAAGTKTIVMCGCVYIDKNANDLPKKQNTALFQKESLLPGKQALHILLKNGTFNGCSLLIPKVAFELCGVFDESLRFNQDSYMWMKLFLSGFSLYCISSNGVKSRIHSDQVTQKRQDLFHKDCEAMSKYLIPAFRAATTEEDRFLFEYAKYNAKFNNKSLVFRIIKERDRKSVSRLEGLIIIINLLYGQIRPLLRNFYHHILQNKNRMAAK